jgi:hypothetical protein
VIAQIGIALLGPTAVFLAQSGRRRLASVIGLTSQPFWLWATFHAHQWGMFGVAWIYTAIWAYGLRKAK